MATTPQTPYNLDNASLYATAGSQQPPLPISDPNLVAGTNIDDSISCPLELVMRLRNESSWVLQEMSEDTGAQVNLSGLSSPEGKRFIIAGPPEARERAKLHVRAWLDVNMRSIGLLERAHTGAETSSAPLPPPWFAPTVSSNGSNCGSLAQTPVVPSGFPPGMDIPPTGFPPAGFPPGMGPPEGLLPNVCPPTGLSLGMCETAVQTGGLQPGMFQPQVNDGLGAIPPSLPPGLGPSGIRVDGDGPLGGIPTTGFPSGMCPPQSNNIQGATFEGFPHGPGPPQACMGSDMPLGLRPPGMSAEAFDEL